MGTTLLSVSADDILRWTDDAGGHEGGAHLRIARLHAIGTIVIIVLIQRLFRGFMGTLSVLLGLVIMTGVAFAMGKTNFT